MVDTICGFSQRKIIEYGLDIKDTALIREVADYIGTGKRTSIEVEGKIYYWISYKRIKKELPILKINNNDALRKRFKKLEEAGILIHYHSKDGGSYSYYNLGENYNNLIEI